MHLNTPRERVPMYKTSRPSRYDIYQPRNPSVISAQEVQLRSMSPIFQVQPPDIKPREFSRDHSDLREDRSSVGRTRGCSEMGPDRRSDDGPSCGDSPDPRGMRPKILYPRDGVKFFHQPHKKRTRDAKWKPGESLAKPKKKKPNKVIEELNGSIDNSVQDPSETDLQQAMRRSMPIRTPQSKLIKSPFILPQSSHTPHMARQTQSIEVQQENGEDNDDTLYSPEETKVEQKINFNGTVQQSIDPEIIPIAEREETPPRRPTPIYHRSIRELLWNLHEAWEQGLIPELHRVKFIEFMLKHTTKKQQKLIKEELQDTKDRYSTVCQIMDLNARRQRKIRALKEAEAEYEEMIILFDSKTTPSDKQKEERKIRYLLKATVQELLQTLRTLTVSILEKIVEWRVSLIPPSISKKESHRFLWMPFIISGGDIIDAIKADFEEIQRMKMIADNFDVPAGDLFLKKAAEPILLRMNQPMKANESEPRAGQRLSNRLSVPFKQKSEAKKIKDLEELIEKTEELLKKEEYTLENITIKYKSMKPQRPSAVTPKRLSNRALDQPKLRKMNKTAMQSKTSRRSSLVESPSQQPKTGTYEHWHSYVKQRTSPRPSLLNSTTQESSSKKTPATKSKNGSSAQKPSLRPKENQKTATPTKTEDQKEQEEEPFQEQQQEVIPDEPNVPFDRPATNEDEAQLEGKQWKALPFHLEHQTAEEFASEFVAAKHPGWEQGDGRMAMEKFRQGSYPRFIMKLTRGQCEVEGLALISFDQESVFTSATYNIHHFSTLKEEHHRGAFTAVEDEMMKNQGAGTLSIPNKGNSTTVILKDQQEDEETKKANNEDPKKLQWTNNGIRYNLRRDKPESKVQPIKINVCEFLRIGVLKEALTSTYPPFELVNFLDDNLPLVADIRTENWNREALMLISRRYKKFGETMIGKNIDFAKEYDQLSLLPLKEDKLYKEYLLQQELAKVIFRPSFNYLKIRGQGYVEIRSANDDESKFVWFDPNSGFLKIPVRAISGEYNLLILPEVMAQLVSKQKQKPLQPRTAQFEELLATATLTKINQVYLPSFQKQELNVNIVPRPKLDRSLSNQSRMDLSPHQFPSPRKSAIQPVTPRVSLTNQNRSPSPSPSRISTYERYISGRQSGCISLVNPPPSNFDVPPKQPKPTKEDQQEEQDKGPQQNRNLEGHVDYFSQSGVVVVKTNFLLGIADLNDKVLFATTIDIQGQKKQQKDEQGKKNRSTDKRVSLK